MIMCDEGRKIMYHFALAKCTDLASKLTEINRILSFHFIGMIGQSCSDLFLHFQYRAVMGSSLFNYQFKHRKKLL